MINIDLDNVNEEAVYRAFNVEGNEAEALNDSYLELFELIGRDAMLKLFKYFRGDKIDCPMRLYRPEFIADLAKQTTRSSRTCQNCKSWWVYREVYRRGAEQAAKRK